MKMEIEKQCLDCNYYLGEKLGCLIKKVTNDKSECSRR